MKHMEKTRIGAAGRYNIIVHITFLFVLIWASAAPGQRGMGDGRGVAQQMLKPRLIRISGKLQEIKTHPCENTTGKADLGTHLNLKDKQGGELNVHLGPAPALSDTVKRLEMGRKLDLIVFRTGEMPPNQYIAQTLILGRHIIRLRDSDLRPCWAGSRFGQEILSPSARTTVNLRTIKGRNYRYYCPELQKLRCFQDGQRPRWRRRCRGRFFGCEWQQNN